MKNRLFFEKMMLAIAPAVTKYHMDLQLSNKSKGESDFVMHSDTARYIAEDCSDIAKAMVEEMERERVKGKDKKAEKPIEPLEKEEVEMHTLSAEKIKSNGSPKASSNGHHKSNGKA